MFDLYFHNNYIYLLQVNYNGAISLSRRFLSAIPQLFPSLTSSIRDSYVFAPLWNFNDIQTTGNNIN